MPVLPPLPPRSRGTIALLEENCTVCMLCVRDCPDWCIDIVGHTEEVIPPSGGRPRQQNMLDTFSIDFSLCMYCGICIEVCPFDALFWAPEQTAATTTRAELVHDRDLLRSHLTAVPPPPAPDPLGEA